MNISKENNENSQQKGADSDPKRNAGTISNPYSKETKNRVEHVTYASAMSTVSTLPRSQRLRSTSIRAHHPVANPYAKAPIRPSQVTTNRGKEDNKNSKQKVTYSDPKRNASTIILNPSLIEKKKRVNNNGPVAVSSLPHQGLKAPYYPRRRPFFNPYVKKTEYPTGFSKLANIMGQSVVSVVGVVLSFSAVSAVQFEHRNDKSITITIIDDSIPEPIILQCFAGRESGLPHVSSVGDIICCKDVHVQLNNGTHRLSFYRGATLPIMRPSKPGGSKSRDEWDVDLPAALEMKLYPYLTCKTDWTYFNQLWLWGQQLLGGRPSYSHRSIGGTTDDYAVGTFFDTTVVILAATKYSVNFKHAGAYGYARLWDGTGISMQ